MCCGHTGVDLVAIRTPLQWVGVTGGIKRNPPVGGVAYGTPKYASTSGRSEIETIFDDVDDDDDERRPIDDSLTRFPLMTPYFVFMVRDDIVIDSDDKVCT